MKKVICGVVLCAAMGLVGTAVYAADVVNINSADSATLQTLNGIGPAKAQAIIDYRTQHGPFAAIADIQNVSGIGPATYANIKDYITVGDTTGTQSASQTDTNTSTSTSSGGGTVYLPSATPTPVVLQIVGQSTTIAGANLELRVQTNTSDIDVRNTDFVWNFGDGAVAEGSNVEHTFAYPGKYVVSVAATIGHRDWQTRLTETVVPFTLALLVGTDGSLGVSNPGAGEANIGGWSIAGSDSPFVIPDATIVLPGETVHFAAAVTGVKNPLGARLLFQSGQIATVARVTPVASSTSAAGVVSGAGGSKTVSPSTSTVQSAQAPADGVSDAAAVGAVAAAGAGFPWWGYGAALAALIVFAIAGVWYARPLQMSAAVTANPADEFEIQ